jgi:hypothetical protein
MHILSANTNRVKPPQRISDVTADYAAAVSSRRQTAIARCRSERVFIGTGTARRAVALGLSVQYRLWLALHYVHNQQPTRPGWLDLTPEITAAIAGTVGLSSVRVRVLMSDTDGLFWRKVGARVYLRGNLVVSRKLARLAAAHDPIIPNPYERDWRCSLPVAALGSGMLAFHAALLAAYIGSRAHGWQGTHAMLARNWQASRGQIQRWIRAAGLTVIHNAGALPLPAEPAVLEPDQHGFSHAGIWPYRKGRASYLMFQRGNTYIAPPSLENPGKCSSINRDLRGIAGHNGYESISKQAGGLMSGANTIGAPSGPCQTGAGWWAHLLRWVKASKLLLTPGWLFHRRTNYADAKRMHRARRAAPGRYYLKEADVMLWRPGPGSGPWSFWLVFE